VDPGTSVEPGSACLLLNSASAEKVKTKQA
jgi:hypothetical protein